MPETPTPSEGQAEAEAEVQSFKEELGPFVVAAEETRMAMVFTDAKAPGNPIIFANDSCLKLTRYERDDLLGRLFNDLLARVDAQAVALVEDLFAEGPSSGAELCCVRKDGSEFWAGIFVSPVKDEAGAVVQYFASFVDLTKHKDEQAQARMLIDELNHRVKNTLSTVQSIVS